MTGDDMYRRPSRDEIAAKVKGALPGASAPGPEPAEYVARFAMHLAARLRALHWTPAALAEKAGLHARTAAAAVNPDGTGSGTGGVSITTAARIAAATGLDLSAMLAPYQCGTCHGQPPAGFTCNECGTERTAA